MSQIHGLLLIVLTISCSRYIPRKIEAKLIDYKKDELIVTLETAERLDGAKDVKEAISATSLIGEAKILGSYFESGSFKTIAKLKLENTTAKEQQILLKKSAKVKSTALNFVYEGSPMTWTNNTRATQRNFRLNTWQIITVSCKPSKPIHRLKVTVLRLL